VGIISINNSAGEDSSEMTHIDILVLNLLVYQVAIPDFDAIVVHGQQIAVRLVIETNLVSSVGADGIAAKGFTSCYLN
jgi:hypothetical protein